MKKTNIFTIILLTSTITFSQKKIDFKVTIGSNYSYIFNSEITQKSSIYGPEMISGSDEIIIKNFSNFTKNIRYTPVGKTGFLIDLYAIFPITKHLSLKSGLGINMNNIAFQTESTVSGEMATIIVDVNNNDTTVIIRDENDIADLFYYNDFNKTYYSDFNKTKMNVQRNNFFLKIPIHLQVNVFKNKLFITSGISLFKLLGPDSRNDSELYYRNLYIENMFINFNLGIEYNLFKNIFVGYNFEPNFYNISNPLTDYSFGDIRLPLNNMSFSISYKFKNNKQTKTNK